MRDPFNNLDVRRVLSPAAGPTDNTAQVGQIIDHANTFGSLYAIQTGSIADADATFVVLLEHGDDSGLSDAAAVPDDQLVGTENAAAFRFDDDNEVRKLGYIGAKRYTRLTITPAANASAAALSAVCILTGSRKRPTPTLADD